MAKQISAQQYNTLRAGYAQKLGFDLGNMTADQEHNLVELMASEGVASQDVKALPGSEINGSIPNIGNEAIAKTEQASPSATKRGRRAAASTSSRDADINRMLTTTAQEWDQLGNLAADVAAVSYSNAFDARLTEFVLEVLPGSQYTGMSAADFLSRR